MYRITNFYKNLSWNMGLLHLDQQLFSGGSKDAQTSAYPSDMAGFFDDFCNTTVKTRRWVLLASSLGGSEGQVRVNCRKMN
jgi:hypothetical protein